MTNAKRILIYATILYFAIAAYGKYHDLLPWHEETASVCHKE